MATTINGIDTSRVIDTSSLKRDTSNELGKNAFLELLVTQMSNQNPLEPTSDTEFISQMANFSSLEQMQNLNGSMQTMTANDLIGQRVTSNIVADSEGKRSQANVDGTVTGTLKIDDEEYLQVMDTESRQTYLVPLSVISTVNAGGDTDMQTLLSQILTSLNTIQTNQANAAAASTYGLTNASTDYSYDNTYFGGGWIGAGCGGVSIVDYTAPAVSDWTQPVPVTEASETEQPTVTTSEDPVPVTPVTTPVSDTPVAAEPAEVAVEVTPVVASPAVEETSAPEASDTAAADSGSADAVTAVETV